MGDERWTDKGLARLPALSGAVILEHRRQVSLWGVQTHSPAEWALIFGEEAGELLKEMCEVHFRPSEEARARVRAEAIQAATLALKIAEMA